MLKGFIFAQNVQQMVILRHLPFDLSLEGMFIKILN